MASRPKLTLSIRERDLGLGHILREAEKLRKKPVVKVGVTGTRGAAFHKDPKTGKAVKTVAYIAKVHEYGAELPNGGEIPERSFIRSTVRRNQAKYDARIQSLSESIFDASKEMPVERALGLLGQEVASDIKNTIRNNEAGLGGPTPLSAARIAQKNAGKAPEGEASTPLIDTAQMVNAVSYGVDMTGAPAIEEETV